MLIEPLRVKVSTGIKLIAAFAIAISFGGLCFDINEAQAEINRAPKPVEKKRKRRYVHPCPPGTEAYGGGPPDGLKVYCRQPVVGGYRKHGNLVNWYANGAKRYEGEFTRGKKHGVWTTYHRNGSKKAVETWYNGTRQKKTKFDRRGKPLVEKDRNAERREKRKKYRWRNDMQH